MKHFTDDPPQLKEPDFHGVHAQDVTSSFDDEPEVLAEEV
jgi:hypothetical protein